MTIERASRGLACLRLEGGQNLFISKTTAQRAGLKPGVALSRERQQELLLQDSCHRALQAALVLLRYRPRSRAELGARLARRSLPPQAIATALDRLQAQGLVDDTQFARSWRQNREALSPRSARLVRQELLQKGLSRSQAAYATAGMPDEDNAYRAAQRRATRIIHQDYGDFERKLGAFLLRRGFTHALARATARRLWDEKLADTASPWVPKERGE